MVNEDDVKRLNEDLEKRHYEFRSNCNDGEGDASACHSWGEWLAVVDRNYTAAAEMYRKNCALNNYAASCFNLGRLYLAGKGVEGNDEAASELFETACKGDHSQACHHLGLMALHGVGRPKNTMEGLEAYKKACALDDANSCNRVASLYLSTSNTFGIERDALQAKLYLEKACDANFAPACHNLAVMYKKGDNGVEPDAKEYEKYKTKTNALVAQAGGLSGVKST